MAEETDCRGAIGDQTVDNLRVPQEATCDLDGTFVQGTVKVERGATLRAQSIRVIGNVQGENAARVFVEGSELGGSFQVKQGGGAELIRSRLVGDVQLDSNSGQAQRVANNDVNGSVQVMSNTGGVEISRNLIDGNLQCKENVPPPGGGGNVVQGNAEDQCASLAGGSPGEAGPDAPLAGTAEPARRSARARRGGQVVSVALRCVGSRRCVGRVGLRARGRRIGSRRFAIAGGGRKLVRVKLGQTGLAMLRRSGRLRVKVTARTHAGAVSKTMLVRA
jgi:hypothetical protein